MVGRNNELGQLQSAFAWANEEHETQIVTVVGEPGVGKSRLLREFDVWLDERPESIVHFHRTRHRRYAQTALRAHP